MTGNDNNYSKGPQKASSSLFLEKWSNTEEINAQLGIIVWAMVLAVICLLGVLVYIVTAPKPIYYIPGAKDAGVSWPNQIEEGSIAGFASSWILNWSNFTPEIIENVYNRSIKYMAPQILAKTRAVFENDIKEILKNRISSQFSLIEEPKIVESSKGYKVEVKGEKVIYMGKERILKQIILYSIDLKKVPATENNLYGLLIDDLKQEEINTSETGK